MQIDLLGQPLVIVGSHQTAVDMLERKTSLYSDRPRLTVARLVGWDRLTALLPYGSRWRETRRLFAPALGSRSSVVAFEPIMNVQITRALPRMVLNPNGIVDEVYRFVVILLGAWNRSLTSWQNCGRDDIDDRLRIRSPRE